MKWVVLLVVTAGCLEPSSVVCDGRVCPSGKTCVRLQNVAEPDLCVDPDQISHCDGVAAFDSCTLAGVDAAACYPTETGEVCLEATCGNGFVDQGEVCDDQNSATGDGCSFACKSNETCGNGFVDPVHVENDVSEPAEQCDDKNLVGGDGCASSCIPEQPRWEHVAFGPPRARIGAAMVYDTANRQALMFGGLDATNTTLGDTWLWDGKGWLGVEPLQAPSPRYFAQLAYDAGRQRAVLFGGNKSAATGGSDTSDTWEWDGAAWQVKQTALQPPARDSGQMAYDAARGITILFGGNASGTLIGDTWTWNGVTWTELTPALSPAARVYGGMAFDRGRNKIVLAGGSTGAGGLGDTWEWDGAQWTMVSGSGGPVGAAALAYDQGTQPIIALEESSGKTLAWDGSSWSTVTTLLPARLYPAVVGDSTHGNVVMFGGSTSASLVNDTQLLSGATWQAIAFPTLPALSRAGSAFDPRRGQLVAFGGLDGTTPQSTTWIVDGFQWTAIAGAGGSERTDASLAYDPVHDQIVRFGGCDREASSAIPFAETLVWTGTAWVDKAPAHSPSPRCKATMAWDPISQRILLFGGSPGDYAKMLDDTWSWDGQDWTPLSPAMKPPGRYAAAMAFDYTRGDLLLFSGVGPPTPGSTGSYSYLYDAWTWTGSTWGPLQVQGVPPSSRAGAALVWNSARHTLMLIGGESFGTLFDDVWELDDTKWRQHLISRSQGPRSRAIVAPSTQLSGVWQFGGIDRTFQGTSEARRLRFEGATAYESCRAAVDHDGDGLAGCEDVDCWIACSPLCPPGVPTTLCDATVKCGDGVCSPVENCSLCPSDCTTDCGAP